MALAVQQLNLLLVQGALEDVDLINKLGKDLVSALEIANGKHIRGALVRRHTHAHAIDEKIRVAALADYGYMMPAAIVADCAHMEVRHKRTELGQRVVVSAENVSQRCRRKEVIERFATEQGAEKRAGGAQIHEPSRHGPIGANAATVGTHLGKRSSSANAQRQASER